MNALAADGQHPFDDFPYSTQNPEGKRVTIENDSEMWELMTSYGDGVGAFSLLCASPRNLFDSNSHQTISRYVYCRDMNTPAYPGDYGSHPATWIDAVEIIKSEIAKVQEYKAKEQ